MRFFVTGATGFVGSAVVMELIAHRHQVRGLARSDTGAAALKAAGVDVHRGTLEEPQSIAAGVEGVDAVIHCAFDHDFTRFQENCAKDRRVIAALGDALAGSSRPLVVTSGVGMKASGESLTEDDRFPENHPNPRMATEAAVDAVVARGVRAMAVRLPQVHGAGDHGFTPVLIGIAREKKFAAYVGEGRNHWPAVHRFDAAKVYRLAAEKGVAGARYHAIAEDGIAMKDLATVIARNLGVPVKSLTPDEAKSYFGWFAHFAGMDSHGSSAKTRAALGWQPTEIGLLEDMAAHYFANAKAA